MKQISVNSSFDKFYNNIHKNSTNLNNKWPQQYFKHYKTIILNLKTKLYNLFFSLLKRIQNNKS